MIRSMNGPLTQVNLNLTLLLIISIKMSIVMSFISIYSLQTYWWKMNLHFGFRFCNFTFCFFFLNINLFILFILVVLGLRFCARSFSSCGKWGPLFIAVRGPLTIAASLVAEHRLQTRMLSNCGSWAQPLCGMRDPPRPGLEPVSPALAGRLSTTASPGKPLYLYFLSDAFFSLGKQEMNL